MSNIFYIRTQRVGGIRFLRIGRFQISFCVCRTNPWGEH